MNRVWYILYPAAVVLALVLLLFAYTAGYTSSDTDHKQQDYRDCVQVMTYLDRPIDTC